MLMDGDVLPMSEAHGMLPGWQYTIDLQNQASNTVREMAVRVGSIGHGKHPLVNTNGDTVV